ICISPWLFLVFLNYSTAPSRPRSSLFPYTTLFRSLRDHAVVVGVHPDHAGAVDGEGLDRGEIGRGLHQHHVTGLEHGLGHDEQADRKSTRLNSSHVSISYAVFCLKKKKIILTR